MVVGESQSGSGLQAFRWTASGGISGLGFLSLTDPSSTARAVSANGAVIAGSSHDAGGVQHAYRWSSGTFTALNTFSCSSCDPVTEGYGVSGNGLVVVGSAAARAGGGALHVDPVRWPGGGTGISDLGNLTATQEAGEAYGASDSGGIIAGSHTSTAGRDAWYWSGSGLNVLPRLSTGTKVTAGALAVSSDASTIVGYSTKRTVTLPGGTVVAVEPQAVRWNGAGYATLLDLGTLPGATAIDSRANAVSPDGAIIVGRAFGPGNANRAFIWDAAHGMRDLAGVLATDYALDVTGWVLSEATGVSDVVAGAFTIVGRGVDPSGNPEGWVAHLAPRTCNDGLDNDTDGAIDFPEDPGCLSPGDPSEQNDCQDGLDNDGDGDADHPADDGCVAPGDRTEQFDCADGIDDDGDGYTDFPSDPGCASAQSPVENPECSDGLDNDGDGNLDHPADAQCVKPSDQSELADCSDGLDNDGDGFTDFPSDSDCESNGDLSEHPQCSDGVDNDGDGDVDYPAAYPDCVGADDPVEAAQCGDGVDNDGDGLVDFPGDPGCSSSGGPSENPFIATSPGLAVVDRTSRALFFVDTTTGAQRLISEKALMEAPQGLVQRGGEILVADPAGLIVVLPTAAQRVASVPLDSGESLQVVLDATGVPTILEATQLSKVVGSEAGMGTKSTWLALPVLPVLTAWQGDALAREASGDFATAGFGASGNGVFRIDRTTAGVAILDPTFKNVLWRDLAVEANGAIVAVGRLDADTGVFRVDPATGLATPLNTSHGWQHPTGVAVAGDGQIYVADAGVCSPTCTGGEIAQVNPASGAASTLSTGGLIAGEMDVIELPEASRLWLLSAGILGLLALAVGRRRAGP